MLFRENGTAIDLSEGSRDPIALDFHERSKEILTKYKFPIRLKTRFGDRYSVNGVKEPSQGTVALFKGKFHHDTGVSETVRYSRSYPTRSSTGKMRYEEGPGEFVQDSMLLSKAEMDKVYFMLHLNPNVKRKMLTVENKQEEAEAILSASGRMAVVNFMLNDEMGDLYADDKRVREMALAFSVPRAEDKQYSLPEVKLALYRALERGEAENDPMVNVKLFRESIGKPDSYKKRAEIQRATDNGILAWNMLRYRVDIKVGETVQKLMDIPTDEWVMKEEVLRRYLDANMEAKELFHKATGESGAWSSGKLTKEMVDAMSDFYEIKSHCNAFGIPTTAKSKELLKEELKERL